MEVHNRFPPCVSVWEGQQFRIGQQTPFCFCPLSGIFMQATFVVSRKLFHKGGQSFWLAHCSETSYVSNVTSVSCHRQHHYVGPPFKFKQICFSDGWSRIMCYNIAKGGSHIMITVVAVRHKPFSRRRIKCAKLYKTKEFQIIYRKPSSFCIGRAHLFMWRVIPSFQSKVVHIRGLGLALQKQAYVLCKVDKLSWPKVAYGCTCCIRAW